MLIVISILGQKKVDLMLFSKTAYFEACNINISIEITSRDSYTKQGIYAKAKVYMPLSKHASIDVSHLDLLEDQDFSFKPKESMTTLYTHVVNAAITSIVAFNKLQMSVIISRNAQLEFVTKMNHKNCYTVNVIYNEDI